MDLVFFEAFNRGFEDPCPWEWWVEVARVVIRYVRRARVEGIWKVGGSAMDSMLACDGCRSGMCDKNSLVKH